MHSSRLLVEEQARARIVMRDDGCFVLLHFHSYRFQPKEQVVRTSIPLQLQFGICRASDCVGGCIGVSLFHCDLQRFGVIGKCFAWLSEIDECIADVAQRQRTRMLHVPFARELFGAAKPLHRRCELPLAYRQ